VAGIGALVIALGALAYLNWGWVDAFIGVAGVIKMMSWLFAGNFGAGSPARSRASPRIGA